jgi:purine nucleoside permease
VKVTAKDLATLVRRTEHYPHNAKHVVCANGLSLSLQASSRHYCTPQEADQDLYEDLEVGKVSQRLDALKRYVCPTASESFDRDYATACYPYTPVATLVAVINDAGGLNEATAQHLRALEYQAERDALDRWSALYGTALQFDC